MKTAITITLRLVAALIVTAATFTTSLAERPGASAADVTVDATTATGTEATDAELAPTGVVQELHKAILDCMRESVTLGYDGRVRRLTPVVQTHYDLRFMASKAIGREWKNLDEAQQARWLDTFARHTVANYAGRFIGFDGHRFEDNGNEPAALNTVIVRTTLIIPNDDDVQLNYRLRKTETGWRIIDVYLNGTVSELALRRAEYSSALERDGFDALVASLEAKIVELSKKTEANVQG